MIVQPYGEFVDAKEDGKSKVYEVEFGQTYQVPANMDVLVLFMPSKFYDESTAKPGKGGYFRLRAMYVEKLDDDETKLDSFVTLKVSDEGVITDSTGTTPDKERTEKEKKEGKIAEDKINWDGLEVKVRGLFGEKLVEIQGYTINKGQAALGAIIAIVLGAMCCCCCLCISYRKKEVIVVYSTKARESFRASFRRSQYTKDPNAFSESEAFEMKAKKLEQANKDNENETDRMDIQK